MKNIKKNPGYCLLIALVFISLKSGEQNYSQRNTEKKVLKEINLTKVWSGHPVEFKILTTDKYQYVAFFDSLRNMCIAQRKIENENWEITKLPSVVEWDSHNYIAMTQDKDGYIHIAGNMHCVPLIYFRSKHPNDINDFERLSMTGERENKVTYPVFFNDAKGDLIFQYRDG